MFNSVLWYAKKMRKLLLVTIGLHSRNTRKAYRLLVLGSVVLTILSLLAHGQRSAAKELYGATSPAWSPDGQHIAYIVQHPDHTDLYVFDVASFTATKLAENASDPSWSPDGQRIAYTGHEGDNVTVDFIDVKGGKSTQLTIGYYPMWSPDGKHLAYLVAQTLHLASADGAPPRLPITASTLTVWDYWWSPDGRQIAFMAQGTTDNTTILYTINSDGSALHKIADSTFDASLAWSPNSKQLLLLGYCGDTSVTNLCVAEADGSSLRRLAPPRLQSSWSPDSRQILFTFNSGVCVMNADGSGQHCLTRADDPYNSDFSAAWSPDNRQIVFVRMHTPQTVKPGELYLMSADGSSLQRLPDDVQSF